MITNIMMVKQRIKHLVVSVNGIQIAILIPLQLQVMKQQNRMFHLPEDYNPIKQIPQNQLILKNINVQQC